MADRQGFDSSQKHTPLHGISLANFGGNLNFGPTLVPASDTPSISFGNQPTATPTASRGKKMFLDETHMNWIQFPKRIE